MSQEPEKTSVPKQTVRLDRRVSYCEVSVQKKKKTSSKDSDGVRREQLKARYPRSPTLSLRDIVLVSVALYWTPGSPGSVGSALQSVKNQRHRASLSSLSMTWPCRNARGREISCSEPVRSPRFRDAIRHSDCAGKRNAVIRPQQARTKKNRGWLGRSAFSESRPTRGRGVFRINGARGGRASGATSRSRLRGGRSSRAWCRGWRASGRIGSSGPRSRG